MGKGRILVTGGCGFIGSHTIVDLLEHGYEVISVDNLVNADEKALEGIAAITGRRVQNYEIDLVDRAATLALFEEHQFQGVIHFAALKSVGESVHQPIRYFRNNLNSLLNVVEGMVVSGVPHLIFSSSCSVYGNSEQHKVTEHTPMGEAQSPYARTKQIGEQMLKDIGRHHQQLNSILLRYFNPAGAHPSALLGEAPINKASNLVPVITETAVGRREKMMVFGDDYPTRDGSCVRDYIHIMDLARAHSLALDYLLAGDNESRLEVFNLGLGEGVTVLEAIHAFEQTTGQVLNYEIGPRRQGDVVAIYSDYQRAAECLGWSPRYGIEEIMKTAWLWEQERSTDRSPVNRSTGD